MAPNMKNTDTVCAKNQTPPLEATHQNTVPKSMKMVKVSWFSSLLENWRAMAKMIGAVRAPMRTDTV
jgi:hypothetical protein